MIQVGHLAIIKNFLHIEALWSNEEDAIEETHLILSGFNRVRTVNMITIKNGLFLLLFSFVFHMGCSSSQDIKALEEETQSDGPLNALEEDLTQEEFQNVPEELAGDSEENIADEVDEEEALDDGEEPSPEEEYLAAGDDALAEEESLEEDEELPSGVLGEVVDDEEEVVDEDVTDELAAYAEEEGEDVEDLMEDETDQLDASFEGEKGFGEMDEVASNDISEETSIGEVGGKKYIPVKKIKTIPYSRQGKIINTVYIIRERDTPASVAQKIYGDSSRSKDLFMINPHLNRSFKIGDKIYYDSVKRPGDTSRIMTYYEDHGIPPQNYISKPGENIRGIASSLFGNREYWKELWATNLDIQSKWGLKAGTSLNYWPQGAGENLPPVQQLAEKTPPVAMDALPPPMDDLPPPMDDLPPPVADIPPPPPMDDMDIPPPPPPMDDDTLPPPMVGSVDEPPAPPSGESEFMAKGGEQGKSQGLIIPGLNKDQTMMVLAGAILFFGLGIIVLIKKREKKRLRSTQTQTQI